VTDFHVDLAGHDEKFWRLFDKHLSPNISEIIQHEYTYNDNVEDPLCLFTSQPCKWQKIDFPFTSWDKALECLLPCAKLTSLGVHVNYKQPQITHIKSLQSRFGLQLNELRISVICC